MHARLLQMAADLTRREEPFVLAVVVRRRPASSAQAGDMALVTAAGEFHGWLGGACTQPTVVREAQRALADGRPRLLALSPDPPPADDERRQGLAYYPMTCHSGGTVEIYLEPVLPAPRLAVIGVSPTARALVKLGKAMGYTVLAAHPNADPGVFPEADRVATDLGALGGGLAPAVATFAVVACMGEGDEEAIEGALALAPAYLGVVASARRFAQLRETLAARGVPAAALAAIRSPAGLAIGATTPEEIALSVLAEIVERRRDTAAADAAERSRTVAAPTAPEGGSAGAGEGAGVAIDPICGMTVEIARARHVAQVAGETHYFCCGGCRDRFVAAPQQYRALGGAA
jgi:xanthine dehydrogenase accessory factor